MSNKQLMAALLYHLKHKSKTQHGFRYIEITFDHCGNEIIMIEYDTPADLNHQNRKQLQTEIIEEINSTLYGSEFIPSLTFYNKRDRLTLYGIFQKTLSIKETKPKYDIIE